MDVLDDLIQYGGKIHGEIELAIALCFRLIILKLHRYTGEKNKKFVAELTGKNAIQEHLQSCPGCLAVMREFSADFYGDRLSEGDDSTKGE